MKSRKVVGIAFDNLKQRKLRTTLTTLGVVVGITTIIALASLGEGLRVGVRQRLEAGFELNVLIVIPGSFVAGLGQPFTPENVASISQVPGVTLVAPMITLPTAQILKINGTNSTKIGAFTVGAVNFSSMQQMLPQRFRIAEGRFPESDQNDTIVLGYRSAVHDGIKIANVGDNVTLIIPRQLGQVSINRTLTVSGILQEGGTSGITNFDYWAFIPLKTAVGLQGGQEAYQIILVQISDPQTGQTIASNIENTFSNPFAISVFVPTSLLQQVDNVLNLIQIFLLGVASISLLVAGIGIMNIMTVSVIERTREVGILKAIGAKSRTILSIFLAEAILIGIIGGAIGILTGYGLSYGLASVLSKLIRPEQQQGNLFQTPGQQPITITPVFSFEWTVAAFFFGVAVCIIFGLYPARKASRLNPVEALRYE